MERQKQFLIRGRTRQQLPSSIFHKSLMFKHVVPLQLSITYCLEDKNEEKKRRLMNSGMEWKKKKHVVRKEYLKTLNRDSLKVKKSTSSLKCKEMRTSLKLDADRSLGSLMHMLVDLGLQSSNSLVKKDQFCYLEKSRRDEVPSVFLSPAEFFGFPFFSWSVCESWSVLGAKWDYAWN